MMFDVVSIGELLVDFTPAGGTQGSPEIYAAHAGGAQGSPEIYAAHPGGAQGSPEVYAAHAGGAPANVACAARIHGLSAAFIGAVGNDHFGELLIRTLMASGVETKGICVVDEAFTTLAFVSLDKSGDREFSFARKPGADTMLRLGAAQKAILAKTRLLHYGTISLSHEPSRTSTMEAVASVRERGGVISFDPNLRLNLWESKDQLLEQVQWGLDHCDILKISEDDLAAIDPGVPEAFVERLLRKGKIKLVLLSLGAAGAKVLWLDPEGALRSYLEASDPAIRAVDTTGAGDIFTGAFLSRCKVFLRTQSTPQTAFTRWLEDPEDLQEMLRYANRAAGLSTMKHGGIPSIPSAEETAKVL